MEPRLPFGARLGASCGGAPGGSRDRLGASWGAPGARFGRLGGFLLESPHFLTEATQHPFLLVKQPLPEELHGDDTAEQSRLLNGHNPEDADNSVSPHVAPPVCLSVTPRA